MPFISEEIYQEHFKKFEKIKSIHLTEWPKSLYIEQKYLDQIQLRELLIWFLNYTTMIIVYILLPTVANLNLKKAYHL